MPDQPVHYRRDGKIAVVTLNRPDRLNAINSTLLSGLISRLEEARDDEVIRSRSDGSRQGVLRR